MTSSEKVKIINVKTGKQTIGEVEAENIPIEPSDLQREYHRLTNKLIRQKYTLDKELSLQRQKETKAEEFEEYFNYCEECKMKAKKKLGMD